MSMPQVEHDGASPGKTKEDGELSSREAVFGPVTADVPTACVDTSSSVKEVLGLRYSDEMNLPPSHRAM